MDGRVFDDVSEIVEGMAVAEGGEIDDERQRGGQSGRAERGEAAEVVEGREPAPGAQRGIRAFGPVRDNAQPVPDLNPISW